MNRIQAKLQAFGKEFISIDEAINTIATSENASIIEAANFLIMNDIHKVSGGVQAYRCSLEELEFEPERIYYEGYYQIDVILDIYATKGGFFINDRTLFEGDCHEYGWIRSDFDSFMRKHLEDGTPETQEERPKQQIAEQPAEPNTALTDTTSLATIGALLELLKKHHPKKTQTEWINEIVEMKEANFPHARGLSESQLQKIFPIAKKAFNNIKNQ